MVIAMLHNINSKKTRNDKMTSIISLLLLFMYLFTLFPQQTSAHAYIIKSSPVENENLSKPPDHISIQFSESVQSGFHSLVVMDSSGKQVPLKNEDINVKNHSILEAQIKEDMPDGTYSIQWKVVSADGHPVQGVIPFSIGKDQEQSSVLKAETTGYVPKADMIVLRWLLYISFALYIGIIVFNLFIYKRKQEEANMTIHSKSVKLIWLAWLGMFISLTLNLPLQTTINAGVTWGEAFKPDLLTETVNQTTLGSIWLIQMVCIIGLFITTYFATQSRSVSSFKDWVISLLFFIGLLISKSLTSHAAGSTHEIMAVFMDFLHLLAASIWLGTLFSLIFLLPRGQKTKYWQSIHRFSFWAMMSVAIILLTGIYGSFEYISTFSSLFNSNYGKVLIGKVLLFLIMLVLGIFHYYKGEKRANKRITRTIGFEFGVGLLVIILAAILTNLPTAISVPTPFNQTKILENGNKVILQISPNVEGINSFKVALKNEEGAPVSNIEQVQLTFTSLDMKMDENTIIVPKYSSGMFQTKGMYLNMAGKWQVSVHMLTKSLDSYDIDFQPEVGGK